MSIAEKLTTIAENEPKIYEAGEQNGLKKAWDTKTSGMTSGPAQYWFYSEKIDTGILEYPLTYKITGGADSTFRASKGEVSLLDIERNGGVKLDWSGCISFNLTFQNSQITEFGVIDASGVTGNFNTVFGASSVSSAKLRYIEKLCVNKNIPLDTAFKNAAVLVHVVVEGKIGKTCDVKWSPLDVESAKSFIMCLVNYSGTGSEGMYYLYFPEDVWARLNADSTSPDGTTWELYVQSLGWGV